MSNYNYVHWGHLYGLAYPSALRWNSAGTTFVSITGTWLNGRGDAWLPYQKSRKRRKGTERENEEEAAESYVGRQPSKSLGRTKSPPRSAAYPAKRECWLSQRARSGRPVWLWRPTGASARTAWPRRLVFATTNLHATSGCGHINQWAIVGSWDVDTSSS